MVPALQNTTNIHLSSQKATSYTKEDTTKETQPLINNQEGQKISTDFDANIAMEELENISEEKSLGETAGAIAYKDEETAGALAKEEVESTGVIASIMSGIMGIFSGNTSTSNDSSTNSTAGATVCSASASTSSSAPTSAA